MQNKRLDLGFYDTFVGEYDEYNPRFVKNKSGVLEILYIIANNLPYSMDDEQISAQLKLDYKTCQESLKALCKINAISAQAGKYKISFPAFLNKDMNIIGNFNLEAGEKMGEIVLGLQGEIDNLLSELSCYGEYDKRVLRYHAIACSTFDGGAIDYISGQGVFTTSKQQPGNRDYLIIGYEDSEETEEFSKGLLCSCNIYPTEKMEFCSFGDANGNRKDMFRFFKRVQNALEGTTEHEELKLSYIRLNEMANMKLAGNCEKLVSKVLNSQISYTELNMEEQNIAVLLRELGYFYFDEEAVLKLKVPVFNIQDKRIIDDISTLITHSIFDYVKNTIDNLGAKLPGLTPVVHMVEYSDIANELWHLMFGAANEYLIKVGFFPSIEHIKGEGRYLRCIYMK